MNKHMRAFFVGSIFVATFIISLTLVSNVANAVGATGFEYIYFRIDTELDVLNDNGVTITFTCDAEVTVGSITDGTASESTGAVTADGIVKLASTSAELTNCDKTDTVTATVSLNGWVTRTWTGVITASTSDGEVDPFTTRASQDYNLVAGLVKNELGGALVLDGTTASVSYSGTTASSSYSGGYKYIAATADGTLTGGGDGYVNKTLAVTWSSAYSTASKSADFNSATASTYNGDQLPFGVKVNLDKADRSGLVYSNIAGATMTAGDSLGVSCTDNSDGDYYCAVPIAHTGVSARADSIPVGGRSENSTCAYTDRTTGGDAQSTCTINANEPASGGGGGGMYIAVATPTPTPSPTPTVTPTPSPIISPVSAKLYRKTSDPKVYVQGSDGALTWVKTLEEFNVAGYSWSDVKVISGSEFAQMKISGGTTSVTGALYRKANDPKVYVQGSDGTLTWVKTIEAFNAAGYSWSDVKLISGTEFAQMRVGGDVRVVKGIGYLRVRSGSSTAYKIVGKVLPNQELKFTEIKNGWYHVDSGWVSGAYVKEF